MKQLAFSKLQNYMRVFELIIFSFMFACVGCDYSSSSVPNRVEMVGEWKSDNIPKAFLKEVAAPSTTVGTLKLNIDGSFSTQSFPQRSPSKLIDFAGTWKLADPSITPSGKWSVDLGGFFLEVRKQEGAWILHQSIDVLKDYRTYYIKSP